MNTKDLNTVVSVVCAISNDSKWIEQFIDELTTLLEQRYQFFEVILVDDASSDGTQHLIQTMLGKIQRVRYLRLSRQFGTDAAYSAGIESALGDVVITMDPSRDPVDRIPEFVEMAKSTGGVVHGVCTDFHGRGIIRESLGGIFRNYAQRYLGISLTRGAADFRAMSRAAVNALLQVRLQNRYLRVLTATLGYTQSEIKYVSSLRGNSDRAGALIEELGKGLDLIAAHTRHPLRVVTWSGVIAAILSLIYAAYALLVFLFRDNVTAGWTTLSLLLSVMFFFLFVILAVVGEYVGTILNEVRARPLYFIAEEKNSSVLLEDTVESSLVGASDDQ